MDLWSPRFDPSNANGSNASTMYGLKTKGWGLTMEDSRYVSELVVVTCHKIFIYQKTGDIL